MRSDKLFLLAPSKVAVAMQEPTPAIEVLTGKRSHVFYGVEQLLELRAAINYALLQSNPEPKK